MGMYFDRNGSPLGLLEWAKMFEDREYQVLRQSDAADDVEVSTVWLGLEDKRFETMIFGGSRNDETWRYFTEAEARQGHFDRVFEEIKELHSPKPTPLQRMHQRSAEHRNAANWARLYPTVWHYILTGQRWRFVIASLFGMAWTQWSAWTAEWWPFAVLVHMMTVLFVVLAVGGPAHIYYRTIRPHIKDEEHLAALLGQDWEMRSDAARWVAPPE